MNKTPEKAPKTEKKRTPLTPEEEVMAQRMSAAWKLLAVKQPGCN